MSDDSVTIEEDDKSVTVRKESKEKSRTFIHNPVDGSIRIEEKPLYTEVTKYHKQESDRHSSSHSGVAQGGYSGTNMFTNNSEDKKKTKKKQPEDEEKQE
jgi:hypothetical protein